MSVQLSPRGPGDHHVPTSRAPDRGCRSRIRRLRSRPVPPHRRGRRRTDATFTTTSDWGTGWEGNYRIANPGPASITSWTVEFDLAGEHRISSLGDATFVQSGNHVTVRNQSWNGTIGAGGSTSFGLGVTYSGAYAAPANCRLNGAGCDGSGGGGGDTTAPSAPTGLRSTGVTSSSVSLARTTSTDHVGAFGNVGADGRCSHANALGQGDAHADDQKSFDAGSSVSGAADAWDQPLKGNVNRLKQT